MEANIVKNFSFNTESFNKLKELCKERKVNRSLLVRMFISYFHNNREKLEELIREYEGK